MFWCLTAAGHLHLTGGNCPASTGHKRAVKRKTYLQVLGTTGLLLQLQQKAHFSRSAQRRPHFPYIKRIQQRCTCSLKTRHERFCEARGAARRSKASRPCPPNALNNSVFQMHLLEGSILNQRNLIKRGKIQSL